MTTPPKLFISYSWTTAVHEAWVVELAEELRGQGIDVILDKWDHQPGHYANAFMEQMVSDPAVTKVLLICDRKYVEKANSRSGGAGIEAQIITPQLYAKTDQDKFVAVVRERDDDNKPVLPVFYKSRIYIDLSDSSTYAVEFEKLVRWAWGKPAFVKPPLGQMPAYLASSENMPRLATAAAFRRAHDAIRTGKDFATSALADYFDVLIAEMESFRIKGINSESEFSRIDESIDAFLPYRNEAIEIFIACAKHLPNNPSAVRYIHRFFERLIPLMDRPPDVSSWNETDFDNMRFIVHELFLYFIGSNIKYEQFASIAEFLKEEFFVEDRSQREPMHSYKIFRQYMRSSEFVNRAAGRLSVRADKLKARCVGVGVEFRYLMEADLVLYLRSLAHEVGSNWWWPETLLYATFMSAPTFEIFARAKSSRYFDSMKAMLDVIDKDELAMRIDAAVQRGNYGVPKWQFDSPNIPMLTRVGEIATTP